MRIRYPYPLEDKHPAPWSCRGGVVKDARGNAVGKDSMAEAVVLLWNELIETLDAEDE